MGKLCTNKNRSYKHNEQINKQNIDNSECFGVKFVKIYPEMTSQYFFEKICFFFTFPKLLTDDCMCNFISRILIDSLAIKNPCLRLIKMCL
jgi:hypothetical protein